VNEFCWNCGHEGHRAAGCLNPKDPIQFEKNCKLFMERKQAAGCGGDGRGCGRGGRGTPGCGGGGNKWCPPTEQEHNKHIIDGKCHNWNPRAQGKGRWFLMNPQPGEKAAQPPAAANLATQPTQAPAPAPTGAPLVPSPHTSFKIRDALTLTLLTSTSSGTVAQVSADAARKEAKKQALISIMQCEQEQYYKHMEEFKQLE